MNISRTSAIRYVLIAMLFAVPATSAIAVEIRLDGYAAIVNDRIITIGEILGAMQGIEADYRLRYKDDVLKEKLREAYVEVRDFLVHQALILEEFESMENAQIPEKLIDEHINKIIGTRFDGDRSQFLDQLKQENVTMEEYRDQMRDRLVVMILRQQEVASKLAVSPGAVRDAYERNRDRFTTPEQVKLRMIVLHRTDEEEGSALKLEEARSIVTQLEQGADFAELARAHSEGRHAEEGGDWGWVGADDFRKELTDAIGDLRTGEHSDVVEAGNALYIIRMEGRRAAGVKPFEEVRDELETLLKQEQEAELFDDWMNRLRRKYYVKLFEQPDVE